MVAGAVVREEGVPGLLEHLHLKDLWGPLQTRLQLPRVRGRRVLVVAAEDGVQGTVQLIDEVQDGGGGARVSSPRPGWRAE